MKRRTFLLSTAAMALSSTAFARRFGRQVEDNPYLETIGLHLNSVRNEMAMDAENTLRAISEVGYKQIELGSTMDADETVRIARDLGMKVNSAFFNWKTIVAADEPDVPTVEAVVEKAAELELKYLVFGYIGKGYRESVEKFKKYADLASEAGVVCSKANIQLCYHNHSFEFRPLEEGVTGMDIFIERFHQDLIKFELDVFGAKIAGKKPIKLLQQLEGRVAQVHLSDIKKGFTKQFDESKIPEEAYEEFGPGVMPFGKIIEACIETGVEQCHIEHTHSPNPLKSIANSYEQIHELAKEKKKKPDAEKQPGDNNNPFGGNDDHDHNDHNDHNHQHAGNVKDFKNLIRSEIKIHKIQLPQLQEHPVQRIKIR